MKAWNDILQALKENCQARLLYPSKLSFRIEGEIKSFIKKKKKALQEFMNTKPELQKILK
jgi:hypothetical protein